MKKPPSHPSPTPHPSHKPHLVSRRQLLLSAGSSALMMSPQTQLFAASAGTPDARLLIVFLRGAYDAANLLVPTSSSFYYESRPNIAVPRPNAAAGGALALHSEWGLHPALKDSVWPLVQRNQAVFVPFAGTHDTSRSHFETQDAIELGQAHDAPRDLQSGFMNRLAVQLGARHSIAFTDQVPLCFRGPTAISNVSLKNVANSGFDPKMRKLLEDMYRNQALAPKVKEGFAVRDEVVQGMPSGARSAIGEQASANRNAINAKGFELEARRVALLMQEKYALGFIDIGGWDTHVNQGNHTGYLATRFEELGRGLAAYAQEMGEAAWQKTTVVVVSEFGRTFRENGNRGTDHGHGTVYWVLGGGLKGPSVTGEQVAADAAHLFQNRDYPVLNEYRSVLGGIMQRQFSLSDTAMGKVFPGVKPKDLGLL